METGPRPPVTAIAPEKFKPIKAGESPDLGEMRKVSSEWSSALAGEGGKGGIVYRENRAIVDPKYADVGEIQKEEAWKGKSDDEILREMERREKEVSDLFDTTKVDTAVRKKREKLRDAFATIYQIDAHIESLFLAKVTELEGELKTKNPNATLTDQQKASVLNSIIADYRQKENAVDDSGTYAPIMAELNRIADPTNGNPGEAALEARQHLQILNYDAKDNKFTVKSKEQVTVEAEPKMREAGYRYLGTRLTQELVAKIKDGSLSEEVLEEIRQNPDAHVVNVANLIYLSSHGEKLGLREDQRANVSTTLYVELNSVQNDQQQTLEVRNAIGNIDDYEHIYRERFIESAKRIGADLAEAGVDIKTISLGEMTETLVWASICESEGLDIRNNRLFLKESIASKIKDSQMRTNVLNIASAGKARTILEREYGMTEEVQKKVNKADVVGETVSALVEQQAISPENRLGIQQLLAAHFAGMDEKHKKKFGIAGVGILLACIAPQMQALMNEGMEPADQRGQPG